MVCRKHANGVFTSGRPATQKGATQDGGPESRNCRLQRKHSLSDFLQQRAEYERLAQAVWARVIAKRRLAREVGSEEKKEEGLSQQPALD